MKIGRGVSELWRVENRPLPLTWPMAYTTACTTVHAVITARTLIIVHTHRVTVRRGEGFDDQCSSDTMIVNKKKHETPNHNQPEPYKLCLSEILLSRLWLKCIGIFIIHGGFTISGQVPAYLTDDCQHVAKSGRRTLRSAERCNNTFSDRSFAVAGLRAWNDLAVSLRKSQHRADNGHFLQTSQNCFVYWFMRSRRIRDILILSRRL